jgi:hypothetical protein
MMQKHDDPLALSNVIMQIITLHKKREIIRKCGMFEKEVTEFLTENNREKKAT